MIHAAAQPPPRLTGTTGGRRLLFALLYFSEGAPIGFIWWYLPTVLRARGVPVEQITLLLAWVGWPWVLKFAWAPLVDVFCRGRYTFKHCILSAQLVMGLSLLPLAWIDPHAVPFPLLVGLLLTHSVSAATQDVAIDAWAISIAPMKERGALSGFMQAGMLSARWLFGAGLLLASAIVPASMAVAGVSGTIWLCGVAILFSGPAESRVQSGPAEAWDGLRRTITLILRRRECWLAGLLALTGGLAFEAVGAVAGPFLVDRGLGEAHVGAVLTATAGAMLLGGLAGGWLADRVDRGWMISAAIAVMAAFVAGLGFTAHEETVSLRVALLVGLYLMIGIFTAGSYALFMDVTEERAGATQFSTLMGLTNACESGAAFAVGKLIAGFGYGVAFVVMGCSSLPSAILPRMIRRRL